jgi:hypothetical protein
MFATRTHTSAAMFARLGGLFCGGEYLFDDRSDVAVGGAAIHDAGAEAEGAADVCVRESHAAAFGHVPQDLRVATV